MTAKRWMLSIEGKVTVTLDASASFADALSCLFASFYVLNIQYQESAACTLELIQRQVIFFTACSVLNTLGNNRLEFTM